MSQDIYFTHLKTLYFTIDDMVKRVEKNKYRMIIEFRAYVDIIQHWLRVNIARSEEAFSICLL